MSVLNRSEKDILRFVVGDYIGMGLPVGSKNIVSRYNPGMSSATVRNKMAVLEEQGYIQRSHSSAGAIPLDKGYRYYVESLDEVPEVPVNTKLEAQQRFDKVSSDVETLASLGADVLSQLSDNVAIVSNPRRYESRLRHIQLVHLDEALILVVWVFQKSRVRKEFLKMEQSFTREELAEKSNRLNQYMSGLNSKQIISKSMDLPEFDRMIMGRTERIMEEEENVGRNEDFYIEGIRYLLKKPEFQNEMVKGIIEVLDNRNLLRIVLTEAAESEGAKIVIGTENREESLKPFSVVLQTYGIEGEFSGTVAIIGSTRMEYSRNIAGVGYISSLMTEVIEHAYN